MMEVANGNTAAALPVLLAPAPAPAVQNGERQDSGGYKLKFCTVCASNQNRYASKYALPTELN